MESRRHFTLAGFTQAWYYSAMITLLWKMITIILQQSLLAFFNWIN